jgi:hypothetical protein
MNTIYSGLGAAGMDWRDTCWRSGILFVETLVMQRSVVITVTKKVRQK